VAERAFYGNGRVLSFGADYDLAQGTLLRYRDPAGVETTFQWDALHRLVGIVKPGDTSDQPTLAFQYIYGNPRSYVVSKSRVEVGKADVIEKGLWYDGLGRQLAAVEQAEDGRTVVSGMRDLGAQGRVIREYEPFFSQGFDLPGSPATRFTAHVYYALGRDVRTVLPTAPQRSATTRRSRSSTGMRRISPPPRRTTPRRARSGSPRSEWCRSRSGWDRRGC
jgi:YD repeat-containing protein